MPALQYERLTEGQKQCLRLLWHERLKIAEVAFRLGVAEDTVDQRLRAARRHLGAGSSMAAARLLAEHEGGETPTVDRESSATTAAEPRSPPTATGTDPSPSPVYPASGIPRPVSFGPVPSSGSGRGAERWRWPLPRWNGEENDLGIGQRLFWVFAIMVASMVMLMLALTMAESLTRLARMLR